MKTLQLTDETLAAVKMAVECAYDMGNDMLTEDVPLSLMEIRQLASKSDEKIKSELLAARQDLSVKMDHVIALGILKHQLSSL